MKRQITKRNLNVVLKCLKPSLATQISKVVKIFRTYFYQNYKNVLKSNWVTKYGSHFWKKDFWIQTTEAVFVLINSIFNFRAGLLFKKLNKKSYKAAHTKIIVPKLIAICYCSVFFNLLLSFKFRVGYSE